MMGPSEHDTQRQRILNDRARKILWDLNNEVSDTLSFPRTLDIHYGLDSYLTDREVFEVVNLVRDRLMTSGWFFTLKWKRNSIETPHLYVTLDKKPFANSLPHGPEEYTTASRTTSSPQPVKRSWWQRFKLSLGF